MPGRVRRRRVLMPHMLIEVEGLSSCVLGVNEACCRRAARLQEVGARAARRVAADELKAAITRAATPQERPLPLMPRGRRGFGALCACQLMVGLEGELRRVA